jgi:predicted glycosyltransferase
MTAEAALLGVPTFSCYPGKSFLIEEFLVRKRLVTREADWRKARAKILEILKDTNSARKVQLTRATELTDSFEDPIDVIVRAVEKVS